LPLEVPTSFLLSFPDFLAPQNTHVVSSLPQPWRPPLLQRALVPFIGEWYGETKFGVLGLRTDSHFLIDIFKYKSIKIDQKPHITFSLVIALFGKEEH